MVAQVCAELGITLTSKGTLASERYKIPLRKRLRSGVKNPTGDDIDQITINTRARDIIRDLFPNIPDRDLFQIIKTAFQKGRGKVGTASELTLVRRAQLSVVAHVRHIFTNYDHLLRSVGYHEARARVEEATLQKLVEWRGEQDNDEKELEDVFREVVVISDNDDSDDDMEDVHDLDQRDLAVEIIPNTRERDGKLDQSAAHPRFISPQQVDWTLMSDDEPRAGARFVSRISRRRRTGDPAVEHDERAQDRFAAWDRARKQWRAQPVPLAPVPVQDQRPVEEPIDLISPEFNFNDPLPQVRTHFASSYVGARYRRRRPIEWTIQALTWLRNQRRQGSGLSID